MLRVDESRHAAQLLRLGDDVQGERRLACRLGTVQLGHPPAWYPSHSQRQVEKQRTGWDRRHLAQCRLLAQLHDRALAVALLDLGNRSAESLFLFQCMDAS